jgi:hypothetical protein
MSEKSDSPAMEAAAHPRPRKEKADGENAVLASIAAMPEIYRALGGRLHVLIKTSAPGLTPRIWYGMPAYAKDGKVVCFFRGGSPSEPERYLTFGFTEAAHLDEGHMWPVAFAVRELTEIEEARINLLVKMAFGRA